MNVACFTAVDSPDQISVESVKGNTNEEDGPD